MKDLLGQLSAGFWVQEVFHQRNRRTQTLQNRVQVAGVPRVIQSTDPGSVPAGLESGSRPAAGLHLIHQLVAASRV